jgi:hypothetical protein
MVVSVPGSAAGKGKSRLYTLSLVYGSGTPDSSYLLHEIYVSFDIEAVADSNATLNIALPLPILSLQTFQRPRLRFGYFHILPFPTDPPYHRPRQTMRCPSSLVGLRELNIRG